MKQSSVYFACFILVSLLGLAYTRVDSYGGWNNSPDTQYHIQTDEGDERYFKYQTLTGQYRKEKRLQDGTVIGTYGWVDPNGYLRLRDYVANNDGYRIVKSKMLYVGRNADVGSSVAAAKNVPPSSGSLVTPLQGQYSIRTNVYNNPQYYGNKLESYNSYIPPSPAKNYLSPPAVKVFPPSIQFLPPVQDFPSSTTPASTVRLQYFSQPSYSSSTPVPYLYNFPSSTPIVEVHPNSIPKFSTPVFVSTTPSPPTNTPAIGVYNINAPSTTPAPISLPNYSTRVAPVASYASSTESSPVAVKYVSSTAAPISSTTALARVKEFESSTPSPPVGYTAGTSDQRDIPRPISGKFTNPVNNFITETKKNKLFFEHERNRYNKRYINYASGDQEYDGISTVQNGFRYFLPRQYHEEESSRDGQHRTGSFGYIDPFGIRRVVYYNTSPGRGFVHRKNNRYVGFNATPYDPRPT